MKVLQITFTYPTGSNAKLLGSIHQGLLAYGYESHVIYGRGSVINEEHVNKCSFDWESKIHAALSLLFSKDLGYSFFSTKRIISRIKSEKYNIVHLHGLNGHFVNAYMLLDFLKRNNIPTVITLHAETLYTAGCDYAYDCRLWESGCYGCHRLDGKVSRYFRDDTEYSFKKILKSFTGFKSLYLVGVSDWVTNRAKRSSVFKGAECEFVTINNGINSDRYKLHTGCNRDKFLTEGCNKLIIHVTPNFHSELKGGHFVIEMAKRFPSYTFLVVGDKGDSTLPYNMVCLGKVSEEKQLSLLYSTADLTLLTSKKETFSLVCAESLCCGTPVVGFEAGGPESIFTEPYAEFVDYGDLNKLTEAIESMLEKSYDKSRISQQSIKKYSAGAMNEQYIKLYKEIIDNEI